MCAGGFRYQAAMTPLRILITNITLATRTGTETYVRDLAVGLLRRGHQPIVYSPELGDIAREMETATVPVVNDLRHVGFVPDVIHGHHHAETLTALLHFPGVPAVGFCHDWGSFWDTPVRHPRVRRYVAVDDTCRDRLIARHGIPERQVRVILNAVDLRQFPARDPLPRQPKRALVFSNLAGEHNYLAEVRAACVSAGITLDVIGQGVGTCHARPGDMLGQYDVVFAKARCALEAMAVGAAVILCDIGGVGGLVSTENFGQLRRLNFGRRTLCEPVRVEILTRELARYNAVRAEAISRRVREEASLQIAIDELLDLYGEVIAEQKQCGQAESIAEGRAAAESMRWLTPHIRDIRALLAAHGDLTSEKDLLRQENAMLRAERELVHQQLGDVHRSTTMRLTRRLRSLPLVPRLLRLAGRGMVK
ncbi:MAG TPA: glycosyltransferase family 4 protein [Gemmataceae bacterium]|nr:glycosyltransferase family 4 protein [Gemmataceae bacterium]